VLITGEKRLWLLLVLAAATQMLLQHSTASPDDGVGNSHSRLAKPGCTDRCGNVSIPYPFGIGQACSLEPGFQVYYHPDNVAILNTSGAPLLEINLAFGEARVQNYIARACNITESGDFTDRVCLDAPKTPSSQSKLSITSPSYRNIKYSK